MDRINLIQDIDLHRRAARRRARKWAAAFVCTLPLVGIAAIINGYQARAVDDAILQKRRLHESIKASEAVLSEIRASVTRLGARITKAERMRDKRQWSALIASIVERIPEGIWLTSLSSDPKIPTGLGNKVASNQSTEQDGEATNYEISAARALIIKGSSIKPAEPLRFLAELRRTDMFETVGHESISRSGKSGQDIYQFEIRCEW